MEHRLVMAITGGGSGAIPALFARPGASRLMLEATVPYHARALSEFTRGRVENACHPITSRRMAVAAWRRADGLIAGEDNAQVATVGLGCTGALATDRQRRGNDRAFITVHALDGTLELALDWGVSAFDADSPSPRGDQEALVSHMILGALDEFGVRLDDEQLFAPAVSIPWPDVQQRWARPSSAVRRLMEGTATAVVADPQQRAIEPAELGSSPLIISGSFNPPHAGHMEMAKLAAALRGQPVWFELSIANADKPELDYLTIEERIAGLREAGVNWVLTRSPRFDEKADLFPGATFLVGADTATRIADPRFYHGGERGRDAAIDKLHACGCRFLVFGRLADTDFQFADRLPLPPKMRELCDPVPDFRLDISGTELRKAARQ